MLPPIKLAYLDYNHCKDPGVDKVLHPIADGVYGVQPAVHGVAGVALVGGHQHPPVGYRQLKVRQGSTRPQTSCQPHHVIHRLPGVLDSPQASGIFLTKVFYDKVLEIVNLAKFIAQII